ncbi:MAG: hypothetical protein GX130_09790 [Candidatus Hydrogenedens sp.]|jgi:hypothetical protein|nr:hypothetical protein [Candidatus Hydrogenedens sp.]
MSKKGKIQITRNDDYEEVDNELTLAMQALDVANQRVETLLDDQLRPETGNEEEVTAPDTGEE